MHFLTVQIVQLMGHACVQAFAEHAETVANFVVADLVDAAVPSGKRKAVPAPVPHMRLGVEIDRTLHLQLAAIKVLSSHPSDVFPEVVSDCHMPEHAHAEPSVMRSPRDSMRCSTDAYVHNNCRIDTDATAVFSRRSPNRYWSTARAIHRAWIRVC